jgi:hypothetical protein
MRIFCRSISLYNSLRGDGRPRDLDHFKDQPGIRKRGPKAPALIPHAKSAKTIGPSGNPHGPVRISADALSSVVLRTASELVTHCRSNRARLICRESRKGQGGCGVHVSQANPPVEGSWRAPPAPAYEGLGLAQARLRQSSGSSKEHLGCQSASASRRKSVES